MNIFVKMAALSGSCLLAACSGDDTVVTLEAAPPVSVSLPNVLLDADFLDSENLRPSVTLDNGESATIVNLSNLRWNAFINLPANSVQRLTITWLENIDGRDLALASRVVEITVRNDGSTEQTSISDYTTAGFDIDGDGLTNFDERRDGSEPFVAANGVPGGEPPITVPDPNPVDPDPTPLEPGPDGLVTLPIPLQMPGFLSGASFLDSADLRPVVSIDPGGLVSVTRITDELWSGTVNVPADDVYKVTVVWVELFQGQDLPLASRTIDYAIGNDGSVQEATGTGFSVDFDTDDDGPANLAEREAGTNPLVDDSELGGTGSLPVIADAVIPRISVDDAPEIDGRNVTLNRQNRLSGEWAAAVQIDSSGDLLSINNLMLDINAEATGNTPFRRWAAMHDGRFLYVVVMVDDDGRRQRDSTLIFNDDSLEVFLDADNSKSQRYDTNDFHRIIPLRLAGANGARTGVSSGDVLGPNSSLEPLLIDFATGPGIGPDGIRRPRFEQDVYELRIPLGMAGISSDAPFGFELQVNDDDDGQERESKWGWRHPAREGADVDFTFFNPSFMGTLILE